MYSKLLQDVMKVEKVEDLCVKIDLKEIVYPLCFISHESLKYLVVDSTGDDGNERKVVIPKSEIISISVVYQQDIDEIFDLDNEEEKMFG